MEITDMRELPPRELLSEASKIDQKIWKLRFQAKGEPIENPGLLKQLKKDKARLLTILREKQRSGQAAGAQPKAKSGSAALVNETENDAG